MTSHLEPQRQLPVVDACDVLVAGAGPAGIGAALAAARNGARVSLIESHGQLGGIWTTGLLSWILDAADKPGVMREILDRLDAMNARQDKVFGAFACDPEKLKLLLETMCLEAGVRVRLHTRVVAAALDEQKRMRVAITESKSGREAWAASAFIDCTGDGDLAHVAGCAWEMGHPETRLTQPMSLIMLIGGVRHADIIDFVHDKSGGKGYRDGTKNLLAHLKSLGIEPSYAAPIIMHVYDDLFIVMTNHAYGVRGTSADDLTRATFESRRELHQIIDALRAGGGPWKDVKIVATAPQIGVREGRRIRGRYVITRDDVVEGRKFDDGVCRVTFGVDVHSPDPRTSKGFGHGGNKAQPYDVPLRALISADVPNLLMAGRCISGDFIAHASYRVTGNAVAMGEAAGVCAALAAKTGAMPHEVPFSDIKQRLQAPGA